MNILRYTGTGTNYKRSDNLTRVGRCSLSLPEVDSVLSLSSVDRQLLSFIVRGGQFTNPSLPL